MSIGFPLVVRTAHLGYIRERVAAATNASTFDAAFARLCEHGAYSQFDVMFNVLWHSPYRDECAAAVAAALPRPHRPSLPESQNRRESPSESERLALSPSPPQGTRGRSATPSPSATRCTT